jgi:hypothetical protein
MKSISVHGAVALVRIWTQFYTMWMEPTIRDARRAEIDSDLWEQCAAEQSGPLLALRIVARLSLGMTDDLRWRVEAGPVPRRVRATVGLALVSAGVLGWFWVAMSIAPAAPELPPARTARWERRTPMPPPPPPPPPFCNPPGSGRPVIVPCTPWP